MIDDFESAVQRVAREKNGGSVDADLFWDIVVALDEDGNKRHAETLGVIAQHVKEDEDRARDVSRNLRKWQTEQANECAERHRDLFRAERADAHVDSAAQQAALVADAAKAAATEAARLVTEAAKNAAGARVHAAEQAADVLSEASITNRRVWAMWGVGIFIAATAASGIVMYVIERILP